MNTAAVQTPKSAIDTEAFAFVQALASELSRGKVDLPSFPDIALRVRQVLSDENVTQDQVSRVVGSEPALAARLMQIANSAAINFTGKAITELRTAINRMGHNMVRSAAIAFAMSQLKKVDSLKGLEQPLDELWKASAAVAAMSHAVARRFSQVNPDTAMLAGLLHGIGKLYILTRSSQHPRPSRTTSPTTRSCATGIARWRRRCSRTGTWRRKSSMPSANTRTWSACTVARSI
jgi:HD-like signal output (HDOD) protein